MITAAYTIDRHCDSCSSRKPFKRPLIYTSIALGRLTSVRHHTTLMNKTMSANKPVDPQLAASIQRKMSSLKLSMKSRDNRISNSSLHEPSKRDPPAHHLQDRRLSHTSIISAPTSNARHAQPSHHRRSHDAPQRVSSQSQNPTPSPITPSASPQSDKKHSGRKLLAKLKNSLRPTG